MGFLLVPTALANIVDGIKQLWVYVAVVLCRWHATDIGTRGDDRLLEAVAQLMRELLLGDAHADTPVLGNEVRS